MIPHGLVFQSPFVAAHQFRFELVKALDENKIGTRFLFAETDTSAIHEYQTYRVASSLDVTDTVMNDTFWAGVHPALSEEMLDFVAAVLEEKLTA